MVIVIPLAMSTDSDSDSVQSQAESSMSSYVHVPSYSPNRTNNQIADEQNTMDTEMNQDNNSENEESIGEESPPRNHPIEPMIRALEFVMLAATSLDLRILPREDLTALSDGFLAQASKTFDFRVVIGYTIAEQSQYDQIRRLGFDDDDDDSNFYVWRTLSSCFLSSCFEPAMPHRQQLRTTRTNPRNSVAVCLRPNPHRLLRRTSSLGNERNSVEPFLNTSSTTTRPLHLWMVAAAIPKQDPEILPEKLTVEDVGSPHSVLPLACLDTKSDHVHCLARRVTSILNDSLENCFEWNIARVGKTLFAPGARSGQQPKKPKWSHGGVRVHPEAEHHINALMSILNKSVVNSMKIVNDQETLRSDLHCFLNAVALGSNELRRKLFIGFNVAKENQFEDIKVHGFQCGPGFHLCKTIENAYSFWTFRKKKTEESSLEHLWIVVGTEVPPSNNNPNAAGLSGSEVLPLACINVPISTGNDREALDKLLADLTKWTQQVN